MTRARSTRRDLLKGGTLAGLGAAFTWGASRGVAGAEPAPGAPPGGADGAGGGEPPRRPGQLPVHDLTTPPRERVRVAFIGCGGRGSSLIREVLNVAFADIVAVCDLVEARATAAAERIAKARGMRPTVLGGDERVWEKLCEREDIDVVYVATPWDWHVPMAVRAMEHGKHAFVEVSAALTVADCWRLVDTSEIQRRHCVMLENCCYGENELFVLNLVRQGVFGDLNHAECAYLHDLRGLLFSLGGEGAWRRRYHTTLDGNLYPTHGLGPVAQYLGLGRGDQMKYVVSVSSPERGLSLHRDRTRPNNGKHADERYRCGDINTSIVKTELGRTVMIQHDVVSPRPYSRINALSGTGATFVDYPARLAVDQPKQYGLAAASGHAWLADADLKVMRTRFTHPLVTRLRAQAAGGGHGGMDYMMTWRHLDCVRTGATPDSVVYDAAAWSSLVELSCRSVASGSQPVPCPDFTRGAWRTLTPLPIVGA